MISVAYLMIADFAEVIGGKAYIQGGGWDRLNIVSGFPHQRSVSIAVGIDIPWDATNEKHKFSVTMLSEDQQSKALVTAEGVLEAGRPPGINPGQTQLIHFAMTGIARFEQAGQYVVEVAIDGEVAERRPFAVYDNRPPNRPRQRQEK